MTKILVGWFLRRDTPGVNLLNSFYVFLRKSIFVKRGVKRDKPPPTLENSLDLIHLILKIDLRNFDVCDDVTYVIRLLQMLETSRKASGFADRIE
jgi:hypothetical protein